MVAGNCTMHRPVSIPTLQLDGSITTLKYKGYVGKVEFDDEAGIFHGEVLDTRDVITFQGQSVDELKTAFQELIDDYLAFCKQRGEEPNKPFSGQFITAFRRSFIARSIWPPAFPARASMPGS